MQEKSPGAAALSVFTFAPSFSVRVVTIDNAPWFVAADVIAALTLDRKSLERLDDDEKGVSSIHTLGGMQEMTVINESGLYSLILGSRKPEAKKFKKWITSEVLPAIRKTGRYIAPQAAEVAVETISAEQYETLARKVWLIGGAFHVEKSAQWWAWKSIRALSGVGAKELPASLYDDALQILAYQDKSAMAFKSRIIEAEELFMRGRLKALSDDFSHILASERQQLLMSFA